MRLTLLSTVLAAPLGLAASASAQATPARPAAVAPQAPDDTIVAVVEGQRGAVDAGVLRTRLAAALGTDVRPLEDEPQDERGLLAIQLGGGGQRATIRYVPRTGGLDEITIGVQAQGPRDAAFTWLVGPCVSLIRAAESGAFDAHPGLDVDNPWRPAASAARAAAPVGVDPWAGLPRPLPPGGWPAELASGATERETEDPWAGLPPTPTAPAPTVYAADDPWAGPPPSATTPAIPRPMYAPDDPWAIPRVPSRARP